MNPFIAQLVEHATVEVRGNREVPGSIPGERNFFFLFFDEIFSFSLFFPHL